MAVERPSDEMLMRLADGELPEEEAAALRARIAADPALAHRFAEFDGTRRAVSDAFAGIAREPVPERLLAAVLAADAARAGPPAGAEIIPLAGRGRPAARRWLPMALAASLAAVLAAPAGYLLGRDAAREAGLRDPLAGAHALVAAALEGEPSGGQRASGGVVVRPLASHAAGGSVCRDFRLDAGDGALLGIACREAGRWRLRASAVLEGGDAMRPASADHPVIAAMLERLGAAPPMDPESEAELLRRGWR